MKGVIKRNEDYKAKARREINTLLDNMEHECPTSDEYEILLKNLEKLSKIRLELERPKFDVRELLPVIGNLGGILLILNYEKLGVISTKALSFVIRGRV